MADAANIEAQAALWVARCDARGTQDDAQLTAWLLADPRHRAAFLRLAEAWTRTERLARLRPANGPVDADLLAPGRARRRRRPARAWRVPQWAAAAVLVAGVMALAWWSLYPHRTVRVYSTGASGLSRVALPDGTVATLNADTELRVSFGRSSRDVALLRGEAQFRVVHDSRRPFEVETDSRTLMDVGTIFDVVRDGPSRVRVLVTHGRVAVLPTDMSRRASSSPLPTISAGEDAVLTRRSVTVRRAGRPQIARWLHWECRELSFQGETLAQAVEEFNRHNYRKLIIDDPQLARLRIGGNFRALDIQSFVAALGKSFDIDARPGPHDAIELYRPAP